MGPESEKKHGVFTCGCVLVVLAVAMVFLSNFVPSCQNMNRIAKASRALSEIMGAQLALAKAMADADVTGMRDLFTDPTTVFKTTVEETIETQTTACYDLLRRGENAEIGLKVKVRSKLSPSYMDLPDDPWGRPYQFYFGPLSGSVNRYIFRSFRGEDYVYNLAAYEEAINESPGAPRPDADMPPAKGFPCPGDLPVYIFSWGRNGHPDQLPWGGNGGDDINNWDSAVGWRTLY